MHPRVRHRNRDTFVQIPALPPLRTCRPVSPASVLWSFANRRDTKFPDFLGGSVSLGFAKTHRYHVRRMHGRAFPLARRERLKVRRKIWEEGHRVPVLMRIEAPDSQQPLHPVVPSAPPASPSRGEAFWIPAFAGMPHWPPHPARRFLPVPAWPAARQPGKRPGCWSWLGMFQGGPWRPRRPKRCAGV